MTENVICDVKRNLSTAKYWVIGKEKAPNTGTPHWQGFLWTHNPIRFPTVQKMLAGTGAHITRGDDKAYEQMMYCKKDGDFEEWGTQPISRKRAAEAGGEATKEKWRKIDTLAKDGNFDELREEFPSEWFRCYRTIHQIRLDSIRATKDLEGPLVNEWLYGESGAGKSSKARRENPGLFNKDVDHGAEKWWDTYEGQDTVLIEDVSPFNKTMTDALKKWSDRYVFNAQYKGGYMTIRPKKLIVTSQYLIDEIWEDQKTRDAMHRRFRTIHVDKEEEERIRENERREQEEKEKEEEEIDLDEEI